MKKIFFLILSISFWQMNLFSSEIRVKSHSGTTSAEEPTELIFDFKENKWFLKSDETNNVEKELIKYATSRRGQLIYVYVKNRNPFVHSVAATLKKGDIIYYNTEHNTPNEGNSANLRNTNELSQLLKVLNEIDLIKSQSYIEFNEVKATFVKVFNFDVKLAINSAIEGTSNFEEKILIKRYNENGELEKRVKIAKDSYYILKSIEGKEFVRSLTLEADFLDIDLNITNINKSTLSAKITNVKVQRKGFKMSFSSGLSVSGSFYNNVFKIDDYGSIESTKSDLAIPSIITLLHIHALSASSVSFGGSFGTGIPLTEKPLENVEFFAGPSIFFGPNFGQQRQRFVFSTGIKLGKIDVLQNGYELHDKVDANFNIDVNVGRQYRPGWFVSFTYNILNKNNRLQFVNF